METEELLQELHDQLSILITKLEGLLTNARNPGEEDG